MASFRSFAGAALLAFAAGAQAQDPSVEEMLQALTPKPQAPLTRGLGSGRAVRASDEGKLELSVQFEYNSARITDPSAELLRRLAQAMKAPALAGRHFRIEGHTDISGSVAGNMRLSGRRAESVRRFLAEAGVEEARMSAIGLGSAVPADKADPAAAVNRRVAILSLDDRQMKEAAGASAASVQRVGGTLRVQRAEREIVAQPGTRLREGDVLSADAGSSALVRLDDGAQMLLREKTRVEVGRLQTEGDTSRWAQAYRLVAGALRYVSGAVGKLRPEAVVFKTTTATIGLRGTDIDVVVLDQPQDAADPGTYVRVNQGAVALGGLDGSRVAVAKDEQAYAGPPKPATRGMKPAPSAARLQAPAPVFMRDALDDLLK